MTIPALSPPAPVPPFAPGALPAINPSPAPATIPTSFINDPTVQRSQIVNMGGVLTGIPFNEGVSGSAIKLPLPPLPTPLGAVVSVAAGAYPLDYQTAGSNLLEANQANSPYNRAVATYNAAVATLQASGAYATYQAALAAFDAAQQTFLDTAVYSFNAAAFISALDTFDAYVETDGDPSPEVIFNAAGVVFYDAGVTFNAAFLVWQDAGFPESGPVWDTYSAALAVWNQALAIFLAATLNAVPAGTAAYEASADYITYAAAWGVVAGQWSAYAATYNAAQSALNWWSTYSSAVLYANANRLSSNPFSSQNPV
jgi:hypothetical protein